MRRVDLVDLICKAVAFGDASAYLLLPLASSDPIVQSYARGETPNDYMMDILRQTTGASDLVMDAGCHVGTFSIGAAANGRSVVAIDANPLHVELMRRSARVNDFRDVTTIHRAVSNAPGQINFLPYGLFGAIDFAGDKEGIAVDTISLDHVAACCANGRPVRFLKMDVEGAEYEALTSAERLLTEDQPVLWWESNGPTLALASHTIREVRELLESHGYKTFRVEGERWVYAPPDQIQPEAWLDMLSLSEVDQRRFTDRIDWTWPESDIVDRCQRWTLQVYRHTLTHLISEIERHGASPDLRHIADESARLLELLG
jgi:FkbM family methyltransferase